MTKQLWGYHIATLEPGETLTGVRYDKDRRHLCVDITKTTNADSCTLSVGSLAPSEGTIVSDRPLTVGTK